MLKFLLKVVLLVLTIWVSLSIPFAFYFSLVLLVGINLFISREFSYKFAFSLGLAFDLLSLDPWILSSALVFLVLVKLAELFTERIYNTDSELRTYLFTVLLLTIIANLPFLLQHHSLQSFNYLIAFLGLNIMMAFSLLIVFRKIKQNFIT